MKKIVPSLLIFVLGVGGMLGCDWVAARYFPHEVVAQWLIVKSVVLVLGAMFTLGFERGFLRRPESSGRILGFSLLNIAALAMVTFIISLLFLAFTQALWVTLASAGLAVSITVSELMRSWFRMSTAQIALNAWKIVLLGLFVAKAIFHLEIEPAPLMVLAIFGVLLLFTGSIAAGLGKGSMKTGYRELLPDARLFALFNVLLVASSYADQFVVGSVKDGVAARIYLAHATVFLAPMLLVAAFFGFQLAPRVRKPEVAGLFKPHIVLWASLSALALGVAFVAVFGALAMKLFYGKTISFDLTIAAMMVAIGIFRIMYAIPSAVLGVMGSITDLRRFFAINASLFILQMLLTIVLMRHGLSIGLAVLIPCLLHWSGKSIQGLYQSYAVLRA